MFPGPRFGREVCDLPVGGGGQSREDVTQVGEGIDSATAATFDDSVEDGAAFAGLGFADEQPVFLAEGGGTDGVFHQVLVNLDPPVVEVDAEQRPEVERVVDGQAHSAAGQVTSPGLEPGEEAMEPLVN